MKLYSVNTFPAAFRAVNPLLLVISQHGVQTTIFIIAIDEEILEQAI